MILNECKRSQMNVYDVNELNEMQQNIIPLID
jgi:hypothetical protein